MRYGMLYPAEQRNAIAKNFDLLCIPIPSTAEIDKILLYIEYVERLNVTPKGNIGIMSIDKGLPYNYLCVNIRKGKLLVSDILNYLISNKRAKNRSEVLILLEKLLDIEPYISKFIWDSFHKKKTK